MTTYTENNTKTGSGIEWGIIFTYYPHLNETSQAQYVNFEGLDQSLPIFKINNRLSLAVNQTIDQNRWFIVLTLSKESQ